MYLTIAHTPTLPETCDPEAELLRPLDVLRHGQPNDQFLVVRRSPESRVWLAPPRQSWLTTHYAFETAYAHAAEASLPVAFMNVIDVATEQSELFEETFRTRERSVDEQPGFLSLEVLRPLTGDWHTPHGRTAQTYVVFSRWASVDAHTAWSHSDAFRRAHGRRRLPDGVVIRANVCAFSLGPLPALSLPVS